MDNYSVSIISSNMTKFLPCRKGDIILWVYDKSGLFSLEPSYDVADLWVMDEGEHIMLTNRIEDVPSWFPLLPHMVGGRNVPKMANMLNNGYHAKSYAAGEISESWQLNVSHYLLWFGEQRQDTVDFNGISGMFRFDTGSLAIILNKKYPDFAEEDSADELSEFLTPENASQISGAIDFIKKQGKPRKYQENWQLG